MMQFWVLVWLVVSPLTGEHGLVGYRIAQNRLEPQLQSGMVAHFEVYQSTMAIMDRWGSLSIEERKTARIFNGNEHKVTERIIESQLTPEVEKVPCMRTTFYCSFESPRCITRVPETEYKTLHFCPEHEWHGRVYHGIK